MAFTPEEKHYRLHFEDEKYDGLEITVKAFNVAKFMDVIGMVKFLNVDFSDLSRVHAEDLTDINKIFVLLADILVEWNLEIPAGKPVETSLEGVKSLDMDICFDILMAAFEAVMAVSSPLKAQSTSGDTSAELRIPMESL